LKRTAASRRRRTPVWTRWCIALGALLAIAGGGSVAAIRVTLGAATNSVAQQSLIGAAANSEQVKHASITGAKNVLLVGIDARKDALPTAGTRSDSIILLHIPKDHESGYMISLPRDSYVPIPAYDNGKQRYEGGKNKINSAFFFGSRGLTGADALSHGFELLSLTIKELTGITPDAGAIIDFEGFRNVVNTLGKVCMYVDEDTTSIHIGKDNKTGKFAKPYVINKDGTLKSKIKGVTANFYAKGNHCFTPTEALDFVRQRDLLKNKDFDYGRQRHQQQFFKAIINQSVKDGLSSPTKLPGLIKAIGSTMTVDSGRISLEDWAFAMKGINPNDLITIKTNEGKFNPRSIPGIGEVEILNDDSMRLLAAAKDDTVAQFAAEHPTWVAST
jgi:anionic cell wall polymer biosynthesis LytR-Cps2A-Psr (LCP) family protein